MSSKVNFAAHVRRIVPHHLGGSHACGYLIEYGTNLCNTEVFAMVDVRGIIIDTNGKLVCGVCGAKEERRKECEGPGPSRKGSVELGAGEGSRCEIRQQRGLRSARHRAGQIRDAAT